MTTTCLVTVKGSPNVTSLPLHMVHGRSVVSRHTAVNVGVSHYRVVPRKVIELLLRTGVVVHRVLRRNSSYGSSSRWTNVRSWETSKTTYGRSLHRDPPEVYIARSTLTLCRPTPVQG